MAIRQSARRFHLFRLVVMALETVDGDGGEFMTFATKRLDCAFPAGHFVGDGVTFDALAQAVFFAANTLLHGFAALVQQKVHVLAAHGVYGFDTFIALVGWRRFRL